MVRPRTALGAGLPKESVAMLRSWSLGLESSGLSHFLPTERRLSWLSPPRAPATGPSHTEAHQGRSSCPGPGEDWTAARLPACPAWAHHRPPQSETRAGHLPLPHELCSHCGPLKSDSGSARYSMDTSLGRRGLPWSPSLRASALCPSPCCKVSGS